MSTDDLRLKCLTQEFRDVLYQLSDKELSVILRAYPAERERLKQLTQALEGVAAMGLREPKRGHSRRRAEKSSPKSDQESTSYEKVGEATKIVLDELVKIRENGSCQRRKGERKMETIGTNEGLEHVGYLWLGNGGQIVLQTNYWAHSYDNAVNAAIDIEALVTQGDADGWEGNDPDARIDVRAEEYRTMGNKVIRIINGDTPESLAREIYETGGAAARDLALELDSHVKVL